MNRIICCNIPEASSIVPVNMFFNLISVLLIGIAFSFNAQIALAFAPPVQHSSSTKQLVSTTSVLNAGTGVEEDGSQSRRELFKTLPKVLIGGATLACVLNKVCAEDKVLGPLQDLVGKWEGNNGFVLIAVPSPGSIPSGRGKFDLLTFPYRETFEIDAIDGGVLQRGGSIDQVSGVCNYTKTVWATDKFPNDPDKQAIIHVENGMFFYLDPIKTNPGGKPVGPDDEAPFSVGRSAIIPHGNTAMIFGNVTNSKGPPTIPRINAFPFSLSPDAPTDFPRSYASPYLDSPTGTPGGPGSPAFAANEALENALTSGPAVRNTVHFSMDSKAGTGGILNTDFVTKRADTRDYKADIWVEDIGNNKKQLQYAETASIFFHFLDKFEINWPHVMVNTLTKVE